MSIEAETAWGQFWEFIQRRYEASGGMIANGYERSHLTVEAIREMILDDPDAAAMIFMSGWDFAVEACEDARTPEENIARFNAIFSRKESSTHG